MIEFLKYAPFLFCEAKSFSEMNLQTDLFGCKEERQWLEVQLPQEAFMSVLKMG